MHKQGPIQKSTTIVFWPIPVVVGQCRLPKADRDRLILPAIGRRRYLPTDTPELILRAVGQCLLHKVDRPFLMLRSIGQSCFQDAHMACYMCLGRLMFCTISQCRFSKAHKTWLMYPPINVVTFCLQMSFSQSKEILVDGACRCPMLMLCSQCEGTTTHSCRPSLVLPSLAVIAC